MLQLGIDIWRQHPSNSAALENGEPLWKTQKSDFYRRPTTTQLIETLRHAAGGRMSDAACIGLCVPGIYDAPRRSISLSLNVPGLMGITLDELLAKSLGDQIPKPKIINDALATRHRSFHHPPPPGKSPSPSPLGTGRERGLLDNGIPLLVEGESPGHLGQVDVSLDEHPPIGPDNVCRLARSLHRRCCADRTIR